MKSRFFDTDLVYKVVALILSVALWIGISVSGNPMEQRIVLVPIEYINLSADQMISSQDDTVNVRIEGRVEDLEFIFSQDIIGRVDLAQAKVGVNSLEVEVDVPNAVQLIGVNPEKVNVTISEVNTEQRPVMTNVTGYPMEGYNALAPVLTPAEVLVEGPQEWLDLIEALVVNINLNAEIAFSKMLPVLAIDMNGNDITERLRISPSVIQVEIPIFRDSEILSKPVHVPLVGELKEGYRLIGLDITPSDVMINGDYEAFLDKVYYETEPVDLDGADRTFSVTRMIINENEFVQLLPEEVQVVVKIARE